MNLADMLSYADVKQLSTIAKHYECPCDTHSKRDMIQSILNTLNHREIFEKSIGSLELEDLRFIHALLFDQREAYSLEELTAKARQARFDYAEEDQNWSPRQTILRFKQRGWLFNGHSHQTKFLFQIPNDLKRRMADLLTVRLRQEVRYASEPEMYREEQQLLAEDVQRFLRFVRQQDITLTQDGVIYKRHLQPLMDALSVQEEPVSKGGWRFGYGRRFRDYPNRFSLLYDYCYYHQYIEEHEGRLRLREHGERRISEGTRESPLALYKFWLKLYQTPVRNLNAHVQWIRRLAGEWVTVQSLRQVLGPFIQPFYYDTPDSILEHRILQMLMHLGLVRIGEHAQAGLVVQTTALGDRLISGTFVADEEAIPMEGPVPVMEEGDAVMSERMRTGLAAGIDKPLHG
ncbi:hypothetical protein [Xylanibacillus composti]|uniref:Uncharacterized protein n=1 Tax=Xylanibacillus composti TaxID=1572762 RepID=A0A8J4H193_9BACL|nr:hypothetical protein [Xylanibacillus composti]GIQ67571.1 hypothetical protein XYCOK13_03950 [Xylanibacillus composti]